MNNCPTYVIIYDIADDKERTKIHDMLKNFGFRIQKSVFECRLDKTGKRKLMEKLQKLDIKTGFVKIYKEEFSFKTKIYGKAQNDPDGENIFFF